MRKNRLAVFRTLILAAAASWALCVPTHAQDVIKIGWSMSKTGPFAAGASVTTLPNYQVWVKDVNDAGGIMLKSIGKKVKIEVIEYDDRSNSEEMIKAVERLAEQDKVDFILPPWSTASISRLLRSFIGSAIRSWRLPPIPIARSNSPSAGRVSRSGSVFRLNWWMASSIRWLS